MWFLFPCLDSRTLFKNGWMVASFTDAIRMSAVRNARSSGVIIDHNGLINHNGFHGLNGFSKLLISVGLKSVKSVKSVVF